MSLHLVERCDVCNAVVGPDHELQIRHVTAEHVRAVLARNGYNLSRASVRLGLDRRTLYRMLLRFRIVSPRTQAKLDAAAAALSELEASHPLEPLAVELAQLGKR